MIALDMASVIRRQIGDGVKVDASNGDRIAIATPYTFPDGDHFGFVAVRDGEGWRLTDEGDVLTKASYSGVDLLAKGHRERLARTVGFYGLSEADGELTFVTSGDGLGDGFFAFTQGCLEVTRLTKISPERQKPKRKDFHERLSSIVTSALPRGTSYKRSWHHPDLDPHKVYGADYFITLGIAILLFAAGSARDCLETAVSCLYYRQCNYAFEGIAVIDDEQAIAPASKVMVDDAASRRFDLSDEDGIREYFAGKVS